MFFQARIRSCRRERRSELRQFVPSGAQNENGRLFASRLILVDLRRIELRSYKVPPRILHA